MNEIHKIFNGENEDEWLKTLPDYQSLTIIELLQSKTPEEAASIWLESTINNNTPFGSEKPQSEKRFFDILKKEVHKLLCGAPEYQHEREELVGLFNKDDNKTAIVSLVSAFIGANLGLSATFIAPALVIIILSITKVTLNTWCQLH